MGCNQSKQEGIANRTNTRFYYACSISYTSPFTPNIHGIHLLFASHYYITLFYMRLVSNYALVYCCTHFCVFYNLVYITLSFYSIILLLSRFHFSVFMAIFLLLYSTYSLFLFHFNTFIHVYYWNTMLICYRYQNWQWAKAAHSATASCFPIYTKSFNSFFST